MESNSSVAHWRNLTIISGGQTGADRAALDFAIKHGIAHGGWCPRGRLAEDGTIAAQYQLQETPSRRYSQRTEWNVRDSDGTVVFSIARCPLGGTALTIALARRLAKPVLHLSLETAAATGQVMPSIIADSARRLNEFLAAHSILRLNVAGPRASQEPRVAEFAVQVLRAALVGS